ncbi:MAG: DUF1761 domain-containing protein [Patescibacteria group bacterium]
MIDVTFWPVFAAGVASVLIGWVWYHPKVFGNAWVRLNNITPEMAERGKKNRHLHALISLFAGMMAAYVMNYFGIAWGVYDWIGAIELGFWCWVGFVAPVMLGTVLWEHKPFRLYLINSLYWLVTLIVMAVVLTLGTQAGSGGLYDQVSPEIYIAE